MVKKIRVTEKIEEMAVKGMVGFQLKKLSLNLESCNLGDRGIDLVSRHIGRISTLKSLILILDKNQISEIGVLIMNIL
jgi:hypothetical protein